MMKNKVIIAANTAWYIANFRLNLARVLQNNGCEVVAIAPPDAHVEEIEAAGVRFIPMPLDNAGINPVKDFTFIYWLFMTLLKEKSLIYLGYTIKLNIYGGLVCRILKKPSIHNITGLGTAFMHGNFWLMRVVKFLYRISLKKAYRVFCQNPDDFELFLENKLVTQSQAARIPGSGVDLERFSPCASKQTSTYSERPFRFLLSARLLWDKGIGEYVEAARQLLSAGHVVECQILGACDAKNKTAISRETVKQWEDEGVISYLGEVKDVRPVIAQADCVVLPSYREGTPRALLEAASMEKPIITTDTVGCKETVDHQITGLLCKVQDASDLADCMRTMLLLKDGERKGMGKKAREKMVKEFDEKIVINKYVKTISEIVSKI